MAEVSAPIGVSQHSLYKWIKAYAVSVPERQLQAPQTEERDIPKKPQRTLPGSPGEVRIHQAACAGAQPRRTCNVMQLHPSGYYALKAAPQSPRAKDDERLLGLLKQAWLEHRMRAVNPS